MVDRCLEHTDAEILHSELDATSQRLLSTSIATERNPSFVSLLCHENAKNVKKRLQSHG